MATVGAKRPVSAWISFCATEVPGSFVDLKATLVRDGSWTGELRQAVKDGRWP
jgi:hypothetical protein